VLHWAHHVLNHHAGANRPAVKHAGDMTHTWQIATVPSA
jgi:hypothetical protein